MILIRPASFHAVLRPAFRSSHGAASSRWSHSIGHPCTWAPRINTVGQSATIPDNLVEERNDEAMKAEGRQVQDGDLGGRGVSVIGNRRGADLAEDKWDSPPLKSNRIFIKTRFLTWRGVRTTWSGVSPTRQGVRPTRRGVWTTWSGGSPNWSASPMVQGICESLVCLIYFNSPN